MPAIFSKNCVLSGEVDCYCLVCCKHLPAEHDVLAHIQDSEHKHNLSSHEYLNEFKYDYIRKVSGVYLCEVCDTTLPTAAKVRLHVTEHAHLERKRGRMLTRTRKCIVFHENIVITENAWNGLIDDTCVLCNVEFQHDSTHTAEQSHVLNLIKSRVTITDNYDIYRQIGDVCQCLTCNQVVSDDDITLHLVSAQHESLLTKCDLKHDDMNENDEGEKKIADNDDAQVNDVSDNVRDESPATELNKDGRDTSINTEPELVKKTEKTVRSNIMPKDVVKLANQHGLSVKKSENEVYCRTCNTRVLATLDNIREHVASSKHVKKLPKPAEVKREAINLKKAPFKDFTETVTFVRVQSRQFYNTITEPYIFLNDTFLLNLHKFSGFVKLPTKIICQFCRKTISPMNVQDHLDTARHKDMMEHCHVVTELEDEFVRQIKTDLYHCGYCGRVEQDWDDMLAHLDTDAHNKCKHEHDALLLDYKMSLIESHVQNAFPFNILGLLNSMKEF